MVRVISQDTFDQVVEENMEEFGMERAEAVVEAREQFHSQGVSLANIVTSEGGSQEVVDAVKALFGSPAPAALRSSLATIQACCKDNLAQRVLATDNGGYSALLRLLEGEEEEVQREVLVTLTSVMEGNPDLLEAQGVEAMWRLASSPALAPHLLDWMLVTLVRHEGNRQAVMARPGLVGHTAALVEEAGDTEVTLRVCRLWVQLVQDDDVRVPFGKAHDHARELVETHGALTLLTRALAAHQEEGRVAGPCLLALASLALRDEYCQQVVDEGGLQVVLDILGQETSEPEVVTRALVLLKVLAGNDRVKTEVGRAGGIFLITGVITKYLKRSTTTEAGCAALAAVCLRQEDNCQQAVVECEAAAAVTAVMRLHPQHVKAQGAAAAAIRNIVSRNKELCGPFVERGAEELLNTGLSLHGEKIGDTLRSALRDLELKVELQERWTGEKILITESFVATEGVHD